MDQPPPTQMHAKGADVETPTATEIKPLWSRSQPLKRALVFELVAPVATNFS